MLIKIFKFSLLFTFIFCTIHCKKPSTTINNIVEKDSVSFAKYDILVSKYTKPKVFLALYFTNERIKKQYDLSKFNEKNSCTLEENLQNYLNENLIKKCNPNFEKVVKWCIADNDLNKIPIHSDEGITFEEIIYNIDKDKFYKQYFKSKNQYYGSLDFQQSCALYFDVVNYLANSNPIIYNNFMKEYFDYYNNNK